MDGDEAVVVTAKKTFKVRRVETSNTCMLVTAGNNNAQSTSASPATTNANYDSINGLFSATFELIPTLPSIHTIRSLLSACAYTSAEYATGARNAKRRKRSTVGDDAEHAHGSDEPDIYTFDDLRHLVQASDAEIHAGLTSVGAVEIDGYWRIVDATYIYKIADNILDVIAEHKWELNAIEVDAVENEIAADKTASKEIARHCLLQMCKPQGGEDSEKNVAEIDSVKLCRLRAAEIFSGAETKELQYEEFKRLWETRCPYKVNPTDEMLKGLALVIDDVQEIAADKTASEEIGKYKKVRYFPLDALPPSADQRFSILFEEKPSWTMEELSPYVSDLTSGSTTIAQLLLKHARSVQNKVKDKTVLHYTKR